MLSLKWDTEGRLWGISSGSGWKRHVHWELRSWIRLAISIMGGSESPKVKIGAIIATILDYSSWVRAILVKRTEKHSDFWQIIGMYRLGGWTLGTINGCTWWSAPLHALS